MWKKLAILFVLFSLVSTSAEARTIEEVIAKISAELNIKFIEQRKFEFKGEKFINAHESITYFLLARNNEPVKHAVIVFRGYNEKNFQTFAGYYGNFVQALLPNWDPKKSRSYKKMSGRHSYLSLYGGGSADFQVEETSSTGNFGAVVTLNIRNKFAQAVLEPK